MKKNMLVLPVLGGKNKHKRRHYNFSRLTRRSEKELGVAAEHISRECCEMSWE